jgi:hypothetical protein
VRYLSPSERTVSFDYSHLNRTHFIITTYTISGCNDYRVNLWKSTKNSYSKKSDKILDFGNNDRDMKMIMGKVCYISTEEHCQNLSQEVTQVWSRRENGPNTSTKNYDSLGT